MRKTRIILLLAACLAYGLSAQTGGPVKVEPTPVPLPLPAPVFPANDQEILFSATPILFEWTYPSILDGQSEFEVLITKIATSTGGGSTKRLAPPATTVVQSLRTSHFRIASPFGLLVPGPQYQWKVRIVSKLPAVLPGDWSPQRNFRIKGDPPAQVLGENCANGGFEAGNFSNWVGQTKSNTGGSWVNGFTTGRFALVNSGTFDPKLGGGLLPVVPPNGGLHAARMGNYSGANQMERLRYDFTVDNQNKDFRFRFAVVLYDSGHPANQQPYFSYTIEVYNSNTAAWDLVSSKKIVADKNDPYLENSLSDANLVYKLWNCNRSDLSAHVGKAARITFETSDCTQGAPDHFAVAYIDGICGQESDVAPVAAFNMASTFCQSDPIFQADGSASKGEIDYEWSIQKLDAAGNPDPATLASQWFNGAEAGVIDLKAFYTSKGKQFDCNSTYQVKLRVSNDCVSLREIKKNVIVSCPAINPAPDVSFCCLAGSAANKVIGVAGNPSYSYLWSSSPSNLSFAQPTPSIPRPAQGLEQYTLVVTDRYGCKLFDQVNAYTLPSFTISLNSSGCTPCQSATLTTQVSQSNSGCVATPATTAQLQAIGVTIPYSYQWSPAAGSGSSAQVSTSTDKVYTVSVSDGCQTQTKSITVPRNWFDGDFRRLTFASAMKPDNPDPLHHLLILDHSLVQGGNLNVGLRPAYNATEFHLYVFDRWGNRYEVANGKAGCNGFANGDIRWDGKIPSGGAIVQQGVYNWYLALSNCARTEENLDWYKLVCTDYGFSLGCLCQTCKKWEWQNVNSRINDVTVIR